MILFISRVSVVTSFSFISLSIWALSFFSWWLWLKVYQLCLSSKRTTFSFIDFFSIVFFISISFIFVLIFLVPSLLLTLSYACSFSSPLRIMSVFLRFVIFLPSWGKIVSLKTFLLGLCLLHPYRFCMIVLSFSFVSKCFLIFCFISSLIHWLFSSILFSPHLFHSFFFFFLCGWFLIS